jgi:ubiquinol oxidase
LNLHDVFVNIRDDEVEHVKTMHACQGITIAQDLAARRKDTPAAALEPPALHAAK